MAAFLWAPMLVLLGSPDWKMWQKPLPRRHNSRWQGDDSEGFTRRYSKCFFWTVRPRSTPAHSLKSAMGHFLLQLTKRFVKSCCRFLCMILSRSVSCRRMELSLEQARLPDTAFSFNQRQHRCNVVSLPFRLLEATPTSFPPQQRRLRYIKHAVAAWFCWQTKIWYETWTVFGTDGGCQPSFGIAEKRVCGKTHFI